MKSIRAHLQKSLARRALGLALVCAWPCRAWADEAADARALVEAAAAEAKLGHQQAALAPYEQAYAAAPRRELAREIAAGYEATLTDRSDARLFAITIFYYQEALRGEGPIPERADLEASLLRVRNKKSWTQPWVWSPKGAAPAATGAALVPQSEGMVTGGQALIGLGGAFAVASVPFFVKTFKPGCEECQLWSLAALPLSVIGFQAMVAGSSWSWSATGASRSRSGRS